MLSNALARNHRSDDMLQKDAATLARELDVEIRPRTRALGIDRGARALLIEDADGPKNLLYGRLVLAVGADPRVFPTEGPSALDIFTVNDLDGYRRWRERIGQHRHILLIGAGLIGCEFANDLAAAGVEVAIIDPAPWPRARLVLYPSSPLSWQRRGHWPQP